MLTEIYLDGHRVTLSPKKMIGQGGEAEVYDIGSDRALKVFKTPDHPDYQGNPEEQRAAAERIQLHQLKLPAFPKGMPLEVIQPIRLGTDKAGKHIGGYDMQFLRGTEVFSRYFTPSFRQAGGISNDTVLQILKHLHKTVKGVHGVGGVLGDFNDLNVLIKGTEAYIVDADSMQFGQFLCKLFTTRFVDPTLCDPHAKSPMLIKPHNVNSDWYAFAMMVVMGMLLTDVWGGVYKPADTKKRIPHTARSLHRISIFDPEVVYPKPATPYVVLPDTLLNYLDETFVKDKRGEFPIKFLDDLRWTKCTKCGKEHARALCPFCATAAPTAVKEVTKVRGKVTATRTFRTSGHILYATYQNGKLRWLYLENGEFKRENGSKVMNGQPDPHVRYRIFGDDTVIAKSVLMMVLSQGKQPQQFSVETFGNLPMFDANEIHVYWLQQGQLVRNDEFGTSFYIGDVLENQTLFWVGPTFGFGFYRAGAITNGFVFDAERKGINDNFKIPYLRGQLIDSTCVFTRDRAWFFTTTQETGNTVNRCTVILPSGAVEATAEALENDGSWLGTIRGKCAVGNFLLSSTDTGIIRVEPQNGGIHVTQEFPDTEPFVDSGTYLFPAKSGLYAVGSNEIYEIKIN